MGALLGIDFGEKRVGLAVTDESGSLANPFKTLTFHSRSSLLREFQGIVAEYCIEKVVVGLPMTLSGEHGPAAQKVLKHVEWFSVQFHIPWVLWDERLTSQEVERILIIADISRNDRKKVRDKLAAQRILQSYLDYHRSRRGNDASV